MVCAFAVAPRNVMALAMTVIMALAARPAHAAKIFRNASSVHKSASVLLENMSKKIKSGGAGAVKIVVEQSTLGQSLAEEIATIEAKSFSLRPL